jgi:hypothetical protein
MRDLTTATQALCLVALLMSGCNDVYSPTPFGDTKLELVPEDWEGTWLGEGGVYFVTKVDANDSSLHFAAVDKKDDEPVLGQSVMYLRKAGHWTFFSLPEEEDARRYTWGRIERVGETVILWGPDPYKFEKLVTEGVLPGIAHGGNVYLSDLDSSHYALIASEKHGVLLYWDLPFILRRIHH